ncbi:unnamed protein product [Moneuplotes crassus]|uniref:Endoplasmic reticulum oxidoreductin-1 n=1 Tax=Euplotes crassus TaxID=5936 RepID=A0AAD1XC13_EUPCR|nr:unnamed protein product [Moneuplotes crassus]
MKAFWSRLLILGIITAAIYYITHMEYFEYSTCHRFDPETDTEKTLLNKVNDEIHLPINQLTNTRFFKYFRANTLSSCPFWEAEMDCITKKCVVENVDTKELEKDWIEGSNTYSISKAIAQPLSDVPPEFEEGSPNQWMSLEDEEFPFADLSLSKEEATGYNGSDIWIKIHEESSSNNGPMERIFSGLHASIGMHISQYYAPFRSDDHYPNHTDFNRRVGFHKERLSNMFHLYHFILSAYNRLRLDMTANKFDYAPQNQTENDLVKKAMNKFDSVFTSTKFVAFPEELLGEDRQEFFEAQTELFNSISKYIDCITCERCKLHAKLQLSGLSAALKIMYPQTNLEELSRNEIVGFFNLIRKVSNSIDWFKWMVTL